MGSPTGRIAVIADTHGSLAPALFEALRGCARILHLGDLGPVALLAELEALAPTLAVAGNTDEPGHAELPERRRLELGGLTLHMRHHPWSAGDLDPRRPALYLHGHIHEPRAERVGAARLLCPGALTRPRAGLPPTWLALEIGPGEVRERLIELESGRVLGEHRWRPQTA